MQTNPFRELQERLQATANDPLNDADGAREVRRLQAQAARLYWERVDAGAPPLPLDVFDPAERPRDAWTGPDDTLWLMTWAALAEAVQRLHPGRIPSTPGDPDATVLQEGAAIRVERVEHRAKRWRQAARDSASVCSVLAALAATETSLPKTDTTQTAGEWSAPMSLAEMARRMTERHNARGRDVEALLKRFGLEHIRGRQYRVRLDTMDRGTRRKIERPSSDIKETAFSKQRKAVSPSVLSEEDPIRD